MSGHLKAPSIRYSLGCVHVHKSCGKFMSVRFVEFAAGQALISDHFYSTYITWTQLRQAPSKTAPSLPVTLP